MIYSYVYTHAKVAKSNWVWVVDIPVQVLHNHQRKTEVQGCISVAIPHLVNMLYRESLTIKIQKSHQ